MIEQFAPEKTATNDGSLHRNEREPAHDSLQGFRTGSAMAQDAPTATNTGSYTLHSIEIQGEHGEMMSKCGRETKCWSLPPDVTSEQLQRAEQQALRGIENRAEVDAPSESRQGVPSDSARSTITAHPSKREQPAEAAAGRQNAEQFGTENHPEGKPMPLSKGEEMVASKKPQADGPYKEWLSATEPPRFKPEPEHQKHLEYTPLTGGPGKGPSEGRIMESAGVHKK